MPESKVRKAAAEKKKQSRGTQLAEQRETAARTVATPGSRSWVLPTFITVGLVSVLWLVVYYVTAAVGVEVPLISSLGGWNVLIGMGGMATAFGLATLWK